MSLELSWPSRFKKSPSTRSWLGLFCSLHWKLLQCAHMALRCYSALPNPLAKKNVFKPKSTPKSLTIRIQTGPDSLQIPVLADLPAWLPALPAPLPTSLPSVLPAAWLSSPSEVTKPGTLGHPDSCNRSREVPKRKRKFRVFNDRTWKYSQPCHYTSKLNKSNKTTKRKRSKEKFFWHLINLPWWGLTELEVEPMLLLLKMFAANRPTPKLSQDPLSKNVQSKQYIPRTPVRLCSCFSLGSTHANNCITHKHDMPQMQFQNPQEKCACPSIFFHIYFSSSFVCNTQ